MQDRTPELGYDILPNGDLKFWVTPGSGAHEDLKDLLAKDRDFMSKWCDFIEPWRCNGYFESMSPEWVGALTDDEACIIATDTDWPDDADHPRLTETSKVWWFPDYMVEDPLVTLAEKGEVIFRCSENS